MARKSCLLTTSALIAARPMVMPDGRTEMTDTDFFYPSRAGHPYATPFLAAHHRPETIFVPEYQNHRNTARDIIGAIYYSTEPTDDAEFFALMSGGRVEAAEGGARLMLADGVAIDILDAATLRERYGQMAPPLDAGVDGYGVGLKIEVRSLAACRSALAGDVGVADTPEGLIVPASAASGCFLLFTEGD